MGMQTITDTLQSFEEIIREANNDAAVRTFTVYKYSLLYLVQTDKLQMNDKAEKFMEGYLEDFATYDHYKVAQAYLMRNQRPLLNYTQSIYHGAGACPWPRRHTNGLQRSDQ